MNENNKIIDVKTNVLESMEKDNKINFVSFSELDKNGRFIEAYGYFEKPQSNPVLDENLGEILSKIGSKKGDDGIMNKEKYLPIGSVVLLKDAKKRIMVTGFVAQSQETGDKIFDYMGCLYPEGIISSEQNLLFNHDQIDKIFYLGYSDEEWLKVHSKLKEVSNEMQKEINEKNQSTKNNNSNNQFEILNNV